MYQEKRELEEAAPIVEDERKDREGNLEGFNRFLQILLILFNSIYADNKGEPNNYKKTLLQDTRKYFKHEGHHKGKTQVREFR
jgi:hypothetical protein